MTKWNEENIKEHLFTEVELRYDCGHEWVRGKLVGYDGEYPDNAFIRDGGDCYGEMRPVPKECELDDHALIRQATGYSPLPPWSEAPEWVHWRCRTSRGALLYYNTKPDMVEDGWRGKLGVKAIHVGYDYDPTNWQSRGVELAAETCLVPNSAAAGLSFA